MRRIVQISGWALIWSGIFIFGYLGWQLYGTDWVNAGVQEDAQIALAATFGDPSRDVPEPEEIHPGDYLGTPPEDALPESVPFHPEEDPDHGAEFAFLRIPRIGVDSVLFEGVDTQTLKLGPGHMEGTPIPGQPGNAVVSGHRTTYGRPFFDFDRLEPGDRIEVETAIGTHVYEIRNIEIVAPTDVWVTGDRPGGWLTLTTCNPKFSARERLVIFAEMVVGPNQEFIELHEMKFS